MVIEARSTQSSGRDGWRDPRTAFYPRLEALRGIAALLVALFHCGQAQWLDAAGHLQQFNLPQDKNGWLHDLSATLLRGLGNGVGAVVLFFAISGFVLSGSLSRSSPPHVARSLKFFIARVFRIYPASVVTILIFATLFFANGAYLGSPEAYRPFALLRNLLLLDASINGVMWTLQIELLAVPLILLMFLGQKRWGAVVPISALCVMVPLSFAQSWNHALGLANLGMIYAFIPGIIAFVAGQRLIDQWADRTPILFTIAVVAFLACRPLIGWFSTWTIFAEALIAGVIVGFLAFGRLGQLGRVFDLGIVRFYGRISYSFFLLHPLTLLVIWKMPETLGAMITWGIPKLVVAFGLFFVSVAVITPLAWANYHYVERPGVITGRRLLKMI